MEYNSFLNHLSAILHNEIGWFDEEENGVDNLSVRLANDATFVRAVFSNRLSIFMQDSTALFVTLLIGMLLEWRVALVALATLPVLSVSAVAQVSIIHICLRSLFEQVMPDVVIFFLIHGMLKSIKICATQIMLSVVDISGFTLHSFICGNFQPFPCGSSWLVLSTLLFVDSF